MHGFLDFERALDGLQLLALFKDAIDERGDLSVRIGEDRRGEGRLSRFWWLPTWWRFLRG